MFILRIPWIWFNLFYTRETIRRCVALDASCYCKTGASTLCIKRVIIIAWNRVQYGDIYRHEHHFVSMIIIRTTAE